MTERPILFTPENVRRILDDQKTQTRRVVDTEDDSIKRIFYVAEAETVPKCPRYYTGWVKEGGAPFLITMKCPFGQVGDRLWVRETWAPMDQAFQVHENAPPSLVGYKADLSILNDRQCLIDYIGKNGIHEPKWRPSIHMPRWACRLVLEITAIRVERVQEISVDDAIAEGCYPKKGSLDHPNSLYHALWDSINAKRGYGWDTNPWVWAITFKKVAA